MLMSSSLHATGQAWPALVVIASGKRLPCEQGLEALSRACAVTTPLLGTAGVFIKRSKPMHIAVT